MFCKCNTILAVFEVCIQSLWRLCALFECFFFFFTLMQFRDKFSSKSNENRQNNDYAPLTACFKIARGTMDIPAV